MLTMNAIRSWMTKSGALLVWTVVSLLALFSVGCTKWTGGGPRMPYEPSLYSRIFKSSHSGGDGLRKKIGVVPFQLKSQFGDPASKIEFQKGLLKAVDGCSSVIFVEPGAGEYPQVLVELPRLSSGEIDNYRLAMEGRRSGLFGVLTGTLTSINVDSEDKGIWFLRKTDYYVQVEALVEIYGMETATKIFDRAVVKRVKVEEADVELIRSQNKIPPSFIEKALTEIIGDLSSGICYSIQSSGWKNYIVSTSGDGFLIASGSRSGIRVGHIFDVYDNERTIEGFGEHRYVFSGEVIGEIEVTAVFEDSARVIPVSGSGFQEGQAVGVKK